MLSQAQHDGVSLSVIADSFASLRAPFIRHCGLDPQSLGLEMLSQAQHDVRVKPGMTLFGVTLLGMTGADGMKFVGFVDDWE